MNPLSKTAAIIISFISLNFITYSQVVPGDPNAVKVEFRFNHELAPTDSGVGINGSFNNWLGGVYRMHEREPDWWYVTLDLLQYGYEYKFVTYTDTVGQTGVTGYFTDPLNPNSGGPFNNSIITVKDPMIYYFLPKTGTTVYTDLPTITANISFANSSQLDLSRFTFKIDGAEIPNAASFYDPQSRMFTYIPPTGMAYTEHTAFLKVFNTNGDSAQLTTTFTLSSFYNVGKYIFMFDSKSPGFDYPFDITRVDAKGDFNSWGSSPMADPDSDGVYWLTTNLGVNELNEYTYVVNSGLYINDPDNPLLSNNYRTYVIKRLEGYPYFAGFNTPSGQVFSYPQNSLTFSTTIFKNDTLVGIDTSSITVTLNGNPVNPIITQSGIGWQVSVEIINPPVGKHLLEFSGADIHGNQAEPVKFVFGIYPSEQGFHFVDSDDDDKGPGSYLYRQDILPGSADIDEIMISAVQTIDSLIFTLKLKDISIHTRIGFYIVNSLNGEYVLAPENAAIKIPEWNNKGVYFTLAPRNSFFFNPASENNVYISRIPMQTAYSFNIDSANIASGEVSFTLPLSLLESVMGSYRDEWYFGAYSFFKDQNGTIKVNSSLGGFNFPENPNVYDVTFGIDNTIQERILNNFIPSTDIGGPRIAVIGSSGRGSFSVLPGQINSQLGNAPEIKIYASGGDLFTDSVKVTGFADNSPGTEITLHVNNEQFTTALGTDQLFHLQVPLTEGSNRIYATMFYNVNLVSTSSSVIYNRIVNHKPSVKIYNVITGNFVTMNADSSFDPGGGTLTFLWEQDPKNPAVVNLNGYSSPSASFSVPSTIGEYYFTVKVTSSAGYTGWARTVIVVDETSVYTPDFTTWHPAWADTQIVYSVFVKTFSDAGTFNDVTTRLPNLKDLGINTIWFLPIHPTTNNIGPDNPGYAITDYYNLLESYGTKAEFENLVEAAHLNGIRIVMDHVVQHTSVLHPFMKDANVYKQYSPYYPFYMWDSNNNYIYLFTWVDLPSINFEEESTRNYLVQMVKYWLQNFEIDGYRCDVAWAVNDLRPSGPLYWQNLRDNLKQMKPDIFLLAEADARFSRYFDKKFDSGYDWNWYGNLKSIFSGSGSIDSLNAAVEYYFNPQFPQHARPFRFLENHDEQRFIEIYGVAATKLAAAVLISSPGIPMLYAGQEVGEMTFRGIINWNDPNNLRPYYKKLTSVRNNNPALHSGDYTRVPNSEPTAVYSFLRTKNSNNVISVFNFGSSQVTANIQVPLELLAFDSTETFYLNDVLNNKSYMIVGNQLKNYGVELPGTSGKIFVLSYDPITETDEEEIIIPADYSVSQNYPNPFNPTTRIQYSLPEASRIKITIYNILGERVIELINAEIPAGFHEAVFNAVNYASGVYFYAIEATSLSGKRNFSDVKKMILLK